MLLRNQKSFKKTLSHVKRQNKTFLVIIKVKIEKLRLNSSTKVFRDERL